MPYLDESGEYDWQGDRVDEGPSDEDIERFDRDELFCPHCGAEIWHDISRCPKCDQWIETDALTRPPRQHLFRQRWFQLLAMVLAVILFLVWGL